MKQKWLGDAVFYEIYPQSFFDTNGDGIGDLDGITAKLDYIKDLGCNALWINPIYDSPFKDAGYDVRDYKKVAPRYGLNQDAYRLFGEAHKRGMHVLLDLVPGHTSEEHAWFKESQKASPNEYSDRYVWADHCFRIDQYPYVAGESERDGIYMLNFFKCQPALNYGFYRPTERWQKSMDDPACLKTREAMKDVMRFWLDRGCDGFRVDMADYLVKGEDEKKEGTSAIWKDVRAMLDQDYPEAVLVSEWSNPPFSTKAGFDCDFLLNNPHTGYSTLFRDYVNHEQLSGSQNINNSSLGGEDYSFFRKEGKGNIQAFLSDYLDKYENSKEYGYISFITGNHDTPRIRRTLDTHELKLAYAFLFTMPGVPFLYYGDEIGMRYLNIPTKEGGYGRTGSRTPMQWNQEKNMGFSTGCKEDLYLPQDSAPDAPDVASQMADPNSLWNTLKEILALRHSEKDLQADGSFQVVYAEENQYPFVYRRGNLLLGVNPKAEKTSIPCNYLGEMLYQIGETTLSDGTLRMDAQSFFCLKIQ